MKPSFKYPTSPFVITQKWGEKNDAYLQFGFSRHNGVDFLPGTGKRLYAPYDGVIEQVGFQPTGAGNYLVIRSQGPYEFPDGEFYCRSTYMHLESTSVKTGANVKQGDLVAIADNTGFSTGAHTHWALQRQKMVGSKYVTVDVNEANNTVDPMPYVDLTPAQEAPYLTIIGKIKAIIELLKRRLPK